MASLASIYICQYYEASVLINTNCQESCPRVTPVWYVGHHVSESHLSELWSYLPLIAGLTSSITHSGRWTGAMFPSSDTGPAMNCWIKLKSENLNITNLQSLLSIQEYEITVAVSDFSTFIKLIDCIQGNICHSFIFAPFTLVVIERI